MKKIALASITYETCSFNRTKTTLEGFEASYFKRGAEVVNVPADERVMGGFVAAVKPLRFALEGTIAVHAMPGGDLTDETYRQLKDMVISPIKKRGPFHALFLNLHPAMTSETEPDTTGAILEQLRHLVGPECFIAVALDHHGNITKRMVGAADVMVGFDTQPHDFPGSGRKAARVMLDIWEKKRKPHAALVKIPMITPQDHFLTTGGPMKQWFDLAREIEKDPAVLVASNFPTQPWLDAPGNSWSSLVYADDAGAAARHAKALARKAWELRREFWRSERLSPAETVAAANAEPKGLVVISDTGDSVWGGAPGDNMALIAEMLSQGLSGPALVPVVDPAALDQAIKAGIGRTITLKLGGKRTAEYAPSRDITGTVAAVAEGGERSFGDGLVSKAARSVLFAAGQLKVVILERGDLVINHPLLYEKLGLDVGRAQMVVLKTASNFQYFRSYQSRLIRADSPGATQSDLTGLRWKHLTHPIYPFEDIGDWSPQMA